MFPAALPGHVLTKICGITTLEDALGSAAAGADAIGINFYPQSKRYHSLEDASSWLADVPPHVARVAVLVNAPDEEVRRIATSGLIDVLQFHGDETPEILERARDFGLPIIKALPLLPGTALETLRAWPADALLLDAYAPGTYGGTGHTIDWNYAATLIAALSPHPVILSGGLNPDNIAEAVRQTRPASIDVASGVEISPGRKDLTKVKNLIERSTLPQP